MNEKSYERSLIDPDDAPKLTREWAKGADVYKAGKLVRRGRPKLDNPKQHVSLRLDGDVLAHYRESGEGWQTRVNTVLREAAGL